MAVKLIIDSLESVPEALREHYAAGSDGKFHLQDDKGAISTLAGAKEHEKNLRVAAEGERDTARQRVTELEGQVTTLTGERDQARNDKGKDVQTLEASWQEKLTAAETKGQKAVDALTAEVERLLVTNTAVAMAGEISTVPELFQTVIAGRLKVEKGADGKYFTRVLDAAGQPSAATIDELKQELLANEKYAAIVISGKGSGGGAGGSGSGGGADKSKKWLDYSDSELSELRRTNRTEYDRLRAEHNTPAA